MLDHIVVLDLQFVRIDPKIVPFVQRGEFGGHQWRQDLTLNADVLRILIDSLVDCANPFGVSGLILFNDPRGPISGRVIVNQNQKLKIGSLSQNGIQRLTDVFLLVIGSHTDGDRGRSVRLT